MTTKTLTLAEFLLARIAEDERAAELAKWPYGKDHSEAPPWDDERAWSRTLSTDDGPLIARMSPSRVLAECEAKRRIIEWHQNWPVLVEKRPALEQTDPPGDTSSMVMRMTQEITWLTEREYRSRFGSEPPTGPVLRYLAGAYADHPDYRDEWRP